MMIRIFLILGCAFSVTTLSAQQQRPITQPQIQQAPVKQAPVNQAQVVPQPNRTNCNGRQDIVGRKRTGCWIRKSSHAFEEAFNKADAKAVEALWKINGDYIDETGQTFAGRDAIEKQYADFFANQSGHQIRVIIDSRECWETTSRSRTVVPCSIPHLPDAGDQQVHRCPRQSRWPMADVNGSGRSR